jgi:Zn-dependent M28 family amino/carboxypeptidase
VSVTGEEYGSVGSGHFVRSLGDAVSDIKACLVLDIVGSGNKYYYITTSVFAGEVVENSQWLNETLVDRARELGYMLEPTILEFASDDGPFIEAGVPTSYLCRCISTSWPYLHTYMDDPEIIDYNALKVLTDICASTMLELANADSLPGG